MRFLNKILVVLLVFSLFNSLANAQTAEQNYKAGETKIRQGDYAGAIEEFSKAIAADPKLLNAYLKRAFCYGLTDQYDKAILDYSVTIDAQPEVIFSYQSRGSAHLKLGHSDEALADFNKVLELDPKNQEAYNNRGFVKKSMGDMDGACKDWYKSKKMGNDEAIIIIKNNRCR